MAVTNASYQLQNNHEPHKPFTFIHIPSAVKLTTSNYLNWKLQLEAILVGHDLIGFVNGDTPSPSPTLTTDGITTPNPAYSTWLRQDKLLFGALLSTLSPNLIPLVSQTTTSKALWLELSQQFAKPSRGHIKQKKDHLNRITKENKSITEFMQEIKICTDELASLGKPMDQEDIIDRVLSDLDSSYDTLIESINSCDTPITYQELHEKLLNKELSLKQHPSSTSALPASAYLAHSRPPRSPNGLLPSPSPYVTSSKSPKPYLGKCQWCRDQGHVVTQCPIFLKQCPNIKPPTSSFNNRRYNTSNPYAHATSTNSPSPSTDWLMDSGASHHVTRDLENLSLHYLYDGTEELLVGDGKGLPITNTGSLTLSSPSKSFHLNNVLHVPSISRNLISISKFCRDNNTSVEFLPSMFHVKDLRSGKKASSPTT